MPKLRTYIGFSFRAVIMRASTAKRIADSAHHNCCTTCTRASVSWRPEVGGRMCARIPVHRCDRCPMRIGMMRRRLLRFFHRGGRHRSHNRRTNRRRIYHNRRNSSSSSHHRHRCHHHSSRLNGSPIMTGRRSSNQLNRFSWLDSV